MSLNMIKIPVIYHGKGSLKELKQLKRRKIFIVTDKNLWELFGGKVSRYFKKKEMKVFDEIKSDPKDTTIIKGSNVAREFKPDLIIGFGGGSVMDVAKMIFFLYEREDKILYDLNPISYFKLGKKSKLVLIPTTSGTGAEHTPGAVVTKTETGQKVTLTSFEIIPSIVIIDPKLTLGMPSKLTAATGVDAIVHAIEAVSNKLNNDFTEACNLHAIKLLFKYLPLAVGKESSNIDVRERVHNGASLAGIGFGNSSCGIAHSCGHALGGVFYIQHGIAVGVMLPYVIEFNKAECEEKYKDILEVFNIPSNQPTSTLVKMIKSLYKEINIPTTLNKLISETDWKQGFEKLVDFAKRDLLVGLNPRFTAEEDFRKIFQCAYEGKSVDW
ncbi:MAG: iron-containing alcohol dehydrogenase [Promethearchaeota archaeon]